VQIGGADYDVSFDEQTLKDIAAITHAEYFHAATAEQLVRVYETLTGRVVLERNETELTALFAALAALLLLSSAGLSLAWFNSAVAAGA
jgi:Ca-activated chloride channel family protein